MLPSPKSALDMDLNLSHIFPTSVRSPLATLPETSVKKKKKKLHPIHNYKKKCPAKRQGTLKYQVKLTVISLSASQQ